jgi:ketosteroid isomerase-like protein
MTATATRTEATIALITRFENGFQYHPDVDALMADMTNDCVFEHIAPAAASFGRHEGQAAVRAVWESLDEHFPDQKFEIVDLFANGDRAACRWVMTWQLPEGGRATLHGVDIFTVRDGKIAEKLTYATL